MFLHINFHASICPKYFNFVKNLPKPVTFNLTRKVNQSPWNVNDCQKDLILQGKYCRDPSASIQASSCQRNTLFGWTDWRTHGKKKISPTTSLPWYPL